MKQNVMPKAPLQAIQNTPENVDEIIEFLSEKFFNSVKLDDNGAIIVYMNALLQPGDWMLIYPEGSGSYAVMHDDYFRKYWKIVEKGA